MVPSWLLFILPLVLLVGVHGDAVVTFDNRAGVDVDVYWRDVERSRWALLTSVPGGMTGGLNTFKGHKFVVVETGSKPDFYKDPPNWTQEKSKQTVLVTAGRGGGLSIVESSLGSEPDKHDAKKQESVEISSQGSTSLGNALSKGSSSVEAKIIVRNTGKGTVLVYWRDEANHRYSLVSEVMEGSEANFNTFKGHRFLIVAEGTQPAFYAHPPNHQQTTAFEWVTVAADPQKGTVQIQSSTHDPTIELSLDSVRAAVKTCRHDPSCITNRVYRKELAEGLRQRMELLDGREEVEETYRDHACLSYDHLLPMESWPIKTWEWTGPSKGINSSSLTMEVKIDRFFERDDARMYLLNDFVRPEECRELKTRATPMLTFAAVTGDSPGEKVVSKARKAKAALVSPNYQDPDDVLVSLRQRIFEFATEHSNGDEYTITGQEPFSVIKYNVSGDEYTLHCDGYCDGSAYIPGGRVATMVVFCEEAERGGQTSFTNADLLIKGKPGQAVYFNYKDGRGYMDQGWTKHSGCPVLEGTKWIATQWIRLGVSETDPWSLFTPTGDRDYTGDL